MHGTIYKLNLKLWSISPLNSFKTTVKTIESRLSARKCFIRLLGCALSVFLVKEICDLNGTNLVKYKE